MAHLLSSDIWAYVARFLRSTEDDRALAFTCRTAREGVAKASRIQVMKNTRLGMLGAPKVFVSPTIHRNHRKYHSTTHKSPLIKEQVYFSPSSEAGVSFVHVPEGAFAFTKLDTVVGPAMAWIDQLGLFHRDGDNPAVYYRSGRKEYWTHGTLDRVADLTVYESTEEANDDKNTAGRVRKEVEEKEVVGDAMK